MCEITFTIFFIAGTLLLFYGGRGVPLMAVLNEIEHGAKTAGMHGTTWHTFENVSVLTNKLKDVIITEMKIENLKKKNYD